MNELKEAELLSITGGEPVSLSAVMAIMIIALTAVIVYRLFMSSSGKAQIPGGFQFEWK
jgi:organic radical activating enzyme